MRQNLYDDGSQLKSRFLRSGSLGALALMLAALVAFAGPAGAKTNKHKACHARAGSQIPIVTSRATTCW
jgi:hypothetical protein